MKKQGQSFYRRRSPGGAVQKIAVYNLLPQAWISSHLENGPIVSFHHVIVIVIVFVFWHAMQNFVCIIHCHHLSLYLVSFGKWNPSVQGDGFTTDLLLPIELRMSKPGRSRWDFKRWLENKSDKHTENSLGKTLAWQQSIWLKVPIKVKSMWSKSVSANWTALLFNTSHYLTN